MTWQLVIVLDTDQRVHVGALVCGTTSKPAEYVELLGPAAPTPH